MKKWLLILLCGLLVITGCSFGGQEKQQPDGGEYTLYFCRRDLSSAAGEGALQAETVHLPDLEGAAASEVAAALVHKLMENPENGELKSAIPSGTLLLSLQLDGTRAAVDLSAPYGTLSGVALTLADQAIALTLTQLPEILTVKITVYGRDLLYRNRQLFSGRDVRLAPEGDVVTRVDALLYFLDGEGALVAEPRTLELYEGDTQVSAVVRAMEHGPEGKGLSAVLPEGFRVKSVWLEEAVCYANLSSGHLETLEEAADLQRAIDAIAASLCSLESVEEVRFLVDGDFAESYGTADISNAYTD